MNLEPILKARERLASFLTPTPLVRSVLLSRATGRTVTAGTGCFGAARDSRRKTGLQMSTQRSYGVYCKPSGNPKRKFRTRPFDRAEP